MIKARLNFRDQDTDNRTMIKYIEKCDLAGFEVRSIEFVLMGVEIDVTLDTGDVFMWPTNEAEAERLIEEAMETVDFNCRVTIRPGTEYFEDRAEAEAARAEYYFEDR